MKTTRSILLAITLLSASTAWSQAAAPQASPAAASPALSDKQKQLLEETNALLKLAAELKVSVDKSNKDQLSLDVVRKAEAVEKLARELKVKIK